MDAARARFPMIVMPLCLMSSRPACWPFDERAAHRDGGRGQRRRRRHLLRHRGHRGALAGQAGARGDRRRRPQLDPRLARAHPRHARRPRAARPPVPPAGADPLLPQLRRPVGRAWTPPTPSELHHTMVFGRAWSEVFEDLEQGRLMRDPSFLVSLPSQTDPSLAPEGRSAAYVLFPTPNLESGQVDWDRMRGPYREHMLSTIEAAGWTGLRRRDRRRGADHPAGLGRPGPGARARRSRRRTRSARPGRSARPTPWATTSSSPGPARSRGSGCRWSWSAGGWPPSA